MASGKKNKDEGLLRGVVLAHAILGLHVLLLALIGLLVLFFRGVVLYLPWILLGGVIIAVGGSYLLYRRLKAQGRSLREMLNSPLLSGRSVEVSLLGGLASIKIGQGAAGPALSDGTQTLVKQFEDTQGHYVRELTELAHLLENGLIMPDEYQHAKQRLLGDGYSGRVSSG